MKLVKSASGKTSIRMSKSEWESYGKKAGWLDKQVGWLKEAQEQEFAGKSKEELVDLLKQELDEVIRDVEIALRYDNEYANAYGDPEYQGIDLDHFSDSADNHYYGADSGLDRAKSMIAAIMRADN
jgi:hypothetical protein